MPAGNHAQGVAYHARRLGIPATIVMPADAVREGREHAPAGRARGAGRRGRRRRPSRPWPWWRARAWSSSTRSTMRP
ncbi:MAG: hypothetical protein U1E17_01395 [Geminicoccaceae bacterium]